MILGQSGLNVPKIYHFTQKNNVPETVFAKIFKKHFESCGNTSAAMGSCMMMVDPYDIYVVKEGHWQCQPEDYLFLYLNDVSNYKKFLKARPNLNPKKYPGNRVPQYYPVALRECFGIEAIFTWSHGKEYWIKQIRRKNVVQICLKKPGHYRILHNYDTETDEFIYSDPLYGFYKRINAVEQSKNAKDFSIVIMNKRK